VVAFLTIPSEGDRRGYDFLIGIIFRMRRMGSRVEITKVNEAMLSLCGWWAVNHNAPSSESYLGCDEWAPESRLPR